MKMIRNRTAQAKPFASLDEAAEYKGADRTARLVEGAKKEGAINMYTSAQSDDMGALVAAFEKKYGLKVTMWRTSSEKVLQRAVTEARANRHTVDVLETNGPELESMHREKILQKVASPHHANLIGPALRPHGEWVGTRLNVFVQAYNTKLVKKEELPKSWEDMLQPRWKGKLGIEAEDADWLAGVMEDLGEARGVKLFKEIVAKNGMSVRKGHTLLTQLVASGEGPFALTVYNYKAPPSRGPTASRSRSARRIRTRRCSSTTSRSARRGRRCSSAATSCRPTARSTRRSAGCRSSSSTRA